MDEDQKSAFNLAINGHNLLITGQGGTGKSFLVKIIIKHLRTKVNKKVAIVCSTGIAATNYTEFEAMFSRIPIQFIFNWLQLVKITN
jgi:Cdc6-like AAA superfamily ATPase